MNEINEKVRRSQTFINKFLKRYKAQKEYSRCPGSSWRETEDRHTTHQALKKRRISGGKFWNICKSSLILECKQNSLKTFYKCSLTKTEIIPLVSTSKNLQILRNSKTAGCDFFPPQLHILEKSRKPFANNFLCCPNG